jgi:hypothetical protein
MNLMAQLSVFLFLFVACGFGQSCIKYNKPVAFIGTLLPKDEAGYRQYIVLKLAQPICVVGEPRDTAYPGDKDDHLQTGVTEMQAVAYGADPASDVLGDRLERLISQRVIVRGDLFPAGTGYHRTAVLVSVNAVDALDLAGREALLAPKVAFKPKDVDSYDVTVITAKRLAILVHEAGSKAPLTPSDRYAPHWMTGGDVLYIDCLDGYEHSLVSRTRKDRVICDNEDACGIAIYPNETVTLKLRCTKRH